MDFMFWIWLAVIVVTAIAEFATMEIVSIWFTFGAIIPFIMAATNSVSWEAQIVVFVVISALLIASLRSVTRRFLFKGNTEKTNLEMYIGMQYRMIMRTDFETVGAIKINDVVWSAVALNRETIEAGAIVQVVDIDGNKFVVRELVENGVDEEEFDFDQEIETLEEQPQEEPVDVSEVKVEETPVVETKKTTSTKKPATAGKKITTSKPATKTTAKKTSGTKVATTKTGAKSTASAKPATKAVSTKSTKATSTKQTTKKTVKKGDNK